MAMPALKVNLNENKALNISLKELQDLVWVDLMKVNEVLLQELQSPVELIPQLAHHLIAAGGKRLRPLLTLLSAHLCGYTGEHHITLAACIEFIHAATLLHDDVVDESERRRGSETANLIWGNKASVLVGDFLFSRAFQLMVQIESIAILKLLSQAASTIAEGEVMQLLTTNHCETPEEEYFKVAFAKTAPLFKAACEIGPLLMDRSQDEQIALRFYGENLGILFQLLDDALDYKASEKELGKRLGDDFREGKITLPVILAYQQGSPEEKTFWQRTLNSLDQKEGDLERALFYLQKHDTLTQTIERGKVFAQNAKKCLEIFPPSPYRKALNDIIYFCLERAF